MRFSILLPTRNRLDLLKFAVETVRRQDYDDWEIVISDNCSEEDVAGFVAALADPRIRYSRSETFIPVTDNWNRALKMSSGEYVLMLGDDDGLLQGYFRQMHELVQRHQAPDFVYSDAIQFAYPGVMPGHAKGFMQIGYASFFDKRREPFLMGRSEAEGLVRASMELRLSFGFNMQHSLINRRAIERLSVDGDFFQSPYPDYYASNALFLKSDRILIAPRPMVVIGITPKSFGYYYFNQREKEGSAFLNNMRLDGVPAQIRDSLLPGSDMTTSWFLSMCALEQNFSKDAVCKTDTNRYRHLQVLYLHQHLGWSALRTVWERLSINEKVRYGLWFSVLALLPFRIGKRLSARAFVKASPYPAFDPKIKAVDFQNIVELFEATPPAYY